MEVFETIKALFSNLGELGINSTIVLLILFGGLFAQSFFAGFTRLGPLKIDAAWRTLIVGSAFVAIWIATRAIKAPLPKDIWEEYFISYIFSTSLYEIVLKRLFNKLLDKLGFNNQKS